MATGDQNDVFSRLQSLLPVGWFQSDSSIVNALLQGYVWAAGFVYSLIAEARQQTRLLTMSGGWLDLFAWDFFGATLLRESGQSDSSFLNRIRANLFGPKGTRPGLISALTSLTGYAPAIIEPWSPADCGVYGALCGYGVAGAYGSLALPYQGFVTAYRPPGSGILSVGGYGSPCFGYGVGIGEYASLSMVQSQVSDTDIYATVAAVIPAGTVAWTRISSPTA